MDPFVAAIVQDSPVFLDLRGSVAKAVSLIGEAAATGARLIAFPETWLPGYPIWLDVAPGAALWNHPPAKLIFRKLFENSVVLGGAEVASLCKAAKAHGCTVVMGMNERLGGTLYNTMLYVSAEGEVAGIHRKLMPTYSERMVWGRGDGSTLTVTDTPVGRVGGLICWEHWMPLLRAAMHAKQELVHVAQWPTVKEMNQVASRQYAFEGQCFVMAAGTVLTYDEVLEGSEGAVREFLAQIDAAPDSYVMRGGSAIIAPDGSYLAAPIYDRRTIVTAEIRPELAIEGRLELDCDGHYSRPDVFRLEVDERARNNVSFVS